HGLVQQIRQAREKVVELGGDRGQLHLALRKRVAELADLSLERLDVAAGRLRAADVLRALVAQLAQPLDLDLQVLALRLESRPLVAVELEAAAREIRGHGVDVLAEQLDVEHGALSYDARGPRALRAAGVMRCAPRASCAAGRETLQAQA